MVAASDCPFDFKSKRDRIAEVLFACKITKCFGCDRLELSVPPNDDGDNGLEKSEDKYKSGVEADDDDDGNHRQVMEMNANHVCGDGYGDVEALNDEIEEESQFYGEVLRIKEFLDNHEDSDALLIDSLTRLQLMPLSVETLKATEIGKSVNALRKHGAKEIRNLVRTLIEFFSSQIEDLNNFRQFFLQAQKFEQSL
ncbi:probable mediator of RNA polymerase ii transcription subunit 26b [Phtheirospermum japonicum]|uniref:Probable mediator of RNA polymerase ii transcription subunit 26b n=1 Tax=Phtheirospermum japonicum TaxID=374723 RepID=A0A830BJW1_9LAMI|nr:probable mediator of RNA polymerase ii transcription subunit 26b [Phtheirospermum japonicum]